ncbi:glycosyltransferase family 4 protein [uncultured Desulfuromusa sp.]|uniref:glycosyltransferase family 4 protein n=1 Tax=uncultured Desulfuromusa sp. TaxID=219183 RepID=UPI002AA64A0E|nr:glycosyltransferase family 4 protein [uncultured Desulfuromusa sp.]
MKVLWIVALPLPSVAHLVGEQKAVFGGWVSSMIAQLSTISDIELGVAMRSPISERIVKRVGGIQYYFFPQDSKDKFDAQDEDVRWILNDFSPDLLHVEGAEFAYAKKFLKYWPGVNIVSMQGILNGYEPYELGELPICKMLSSLHPIKMIIAAALLVSKIYFFNSRLKVEEETIGLAQNILGRTKWDRAHSYAINHFAPYFSCNRILRNIFYQKLWSVDGMQRHTFFIGNAASPKKGAHIALYALALLKREYPNVKMYVAGISPALTSQFELKKKISYSAYLRYLIKVLDIVDNIEFLGVLQEDEMADILSKVNVYVLSSIIENSPNTLGEAMIMGVPSVSAYVGGAPDMAKDGEEALFYRANDPKLLAYQVKRIFDDDGLAIKLSKSGRIRAIDTHDPKKNLEKLLVAYRAILD